MQTHNQSLYQVNTPVLLTALSKKLGRPALLDDVPDDLLDKFAKQGFQWIYFLSVWQKGLFGQKISRENPDWQQDFKNTLPDLQEEDIGGSGFAIASYTVATNFGGLKALQKLRRRLKKRGLKLMLDFVLNHMAPDHHWVEEHPDFFITGNEELLAREPQNYVRIKRKNDELILAHGRDPYFPGWPDTIQLDYSNPATQKAMCKELENIAALCDGVRCDMAMLILPEVFERTWGRKAQPFWPTAIAQVRKHFPNFCFMAEAYWDMEWTLQQNGFDYTYDKRLYDRLVTGLARPVREHLHAALDYQIKLVRFLENHDEPRAATTFFLQKHRAAAIITYTIPGMRFFHQGQFGGFTKRISPHLIRGPEESEDKDLHIFYAQLLEVLHKPAMIDGTWQLLECLAAWENNASWDAFIVHTWQGINGERILVVVNYAPHRSQCYVKLPFPEIKDHSVKLNDLLSLASYDRDGNELLEHGLYLDLESWGLHVFAVNLI